MTTVRPYREGDPLWELKRAFETELGAGTGDEAKAARYEAKLDADYREGYLAWVGRCVAENERCVQVAERDGEVAGYVFVLPASMAWVWDAAVLNELFVREAHRGTDAADELLAAAVAVAREQETPLDRLVLDVDPDNERARAAYERWGFEPWGELLARGL